MTVNPATSEPSAKSLSRGSVGLEQGMLMSQELNVSFIYIYILKKKTLRKNRLQLRSIFWSTAQASPYHCEAYTQQTCYLTSMVTVTLNPVSRGSQATSVLEKKVSKMSTPCSEDADWVLWPHFHKLCPCHSFILSKRQPDAYNRTSSFLLAFSSLERENLNCMLAVPTPALEKLVNTSFLPLLRSLCSRKWQFD